MVTIPREGKNSLLPLLSLAVELFIQLPVSIRCTGKLAILGTCWMPLSSCTKVHSSSSDGNIFHLLPTDFAIWTRNWKQVYLIWKKILKNQSCTLWIIWFSRLHKSRAKHQNLLQHKPCFIYNIKTSCIVSLVIYLARSHVLLSSTEYFLFPDN